MAAFNKSVLVGNLTNDPECAEVGEKNTARCNFRLAVNNPRSKDEVLYMNITVWGKSAESCHKYLQKGSSVLVEGRIRQSKLDNGSYWTEVVADTVQFLGKTKGAEASASTKVDEIEERAFQNSQPCAAGWTYTHPFGDRGIQYTSAQPHICPY